MFHLLGFHAYVNEIQVLEAISPVKNLVRQCCAEGFNSGVKGLKRFGLPGPCSPSRMDVISYGCASSLAMKLV
jgi:hypothetical protein